MTDHQEKIAALEEASFQAYFVPAFTNSYNKCASELNLPQIDLNDGGEDVLTALDTYADLVKQAAAAGIDLESETQEKIASNELSDEDIEYVKVALSDEPFLQLIQEAFDEAN